MDITFFWASFILYFCSTLLHTGYLAFNREKLARAATLVLFLAWLAQGAAFIVRVRACGHLPLTNMFEFITMLAWFAGLAYLVSAFYLRFRLLEALAGPVIFMLYVSASLLPKESNQQLMPALQSYWLQIHVSMAAAGESVFLLAFVAAVLYLLKAGGKGAGGFLGRMPDAEKLDDMTYRFIMIGYPLFTMGALFAGAIWAYRAWGTFWSWDPKETCSLIAWIVYSVYLHARLTRQWRGKKTAWLAVAGFLTTLLTFFANLLLGGLHSYN